MTDQDRKDCHEVKSTCNMCHTQMNCFSLKPTKNIKINIPVCTNPKCPNYALLQVNKEILQVNKEILMDSEL